MIITFQALSLVEKVEPVQVRSTRRSRDQWSEFVNARWIESLHGFLHGIKWIMFHGHLDYLQKPFLGDRPNTKPRDHGMHSERSQTLIMQQIRLDNFLYVKNWWCTLPCIPFLLSFMVPNCFYGWRLISMIICSLMLTNQGLIDMLSTTSVRTCAMIWRGPNL